MMTSPNDLIPEHMASKHSKAARAALDCFAALAMTVN